MQKPPSIPYNTSAWVSTSPEVRPAVNENWQARRDLAEALRHLNCAVLTSDVPTEQLQSVTAMVRAEVAGIEANEKVFGNKVQTERLAAQDGRLPDMFYEMSPAMGQGNAIAPPMHIWQADGRVHARVTPGWGYEGPFEHLHGGMIALMFDQLIAVAALTSGGRGRPGTLTTRFHHPTPLNKTLRLVADIDREEGRKQYIVGELWVDDVRTASCEGVLVIARKPSGASDSQGSAD